MIKTNKKNMEGTKNIRKAAMNLLNDFNEKIASKEFSLNQPKGRTDEWILDSWSMELEFLRKNKEDLEKQIIENEFDF